MLARSRERAKVGLVAYRNAVAKATEHVLPRLIEISESQFTVTIVSLDVLRGRSYSLPAMAVIIDCKIFRVSNRVDFMLFHSANSVMFELSTQWNLIVYYFFFVSFLIHLSPPFPQILIFGSFVSVCLYCVFPVLSDHTNTLLFILYILTFNVSEIYVVGARTWKFVGSRI